MAADGEPAAEDFHSPVFGFYVEDLGSDVDLVGLIAYALYKRQKRAWTVGFRADKDRPPSATETVGLIRGYMTDDARFTYRRRAADLLNGYGEVYVAEKTPIIREDALNNEALRSAQMLQRAMAEKSGLWPSVWSGVIVTALWTLLITVLAAAIGPDFFRAVATALSSR